MEKANPIPKLNYIVLFVVATVTLGLEILLTRVFSVVLFSSHSFMAISLALLGTGAGAILAYLGKTLGKDRLKTRMLIALVVMAILVTVSFFSLLQIEFVPMDVPAPGYDGKLMKDLSYKKQLMVFESHPEVFSSWKLYLALPLAFLPFLIAGYLQAIIFRGAPKKFGKLYGIDLIGATFGSLTIPMLLYPLGLMGTIGVITFLVVTPVVYFFITDSKRWPVLAGICLPMVVFIVLATSGAFRVQHTAGFYEEKLMREYWSPFARVALLKYRNRDTYVIDNSSRTYYARDRESDVKRYENSLYNIPFRLKKGGKVLIIASGGGQEVMMASRAGMERIDAVEIAGPIVRDIVNRRKNDKGNPYLLPNVHYHIADGRSISMRAKFKYDVIEMLEVNCWTLAGQISQAWSPYFVFTQEAFSEYMDHLKDDGLLVYTIFSGSANPVGGKSGRRFRSVIAGLKQFGIKNPEDHIIILSRNYSYGYRNAVFAKKTPFTAREIETIMKEAGKLKKFKKDDVKFIKSMAAKLENGETLSNKEEKSLKRTAAKNLPVFMSRFPALKEFVVDNQKSIMKRANRSEVDVRVLFPNLKKLKIKPDPAPGTRLQPVTKYLQRIMKMCKETKPIIGLFETMGITEYIEEPINDDRPYLTGSGLRESAPFWEKPLGELYKKLLKIISALTLLFVIIPFVVRRPGGKGTEKVRIKLRLLLILILTGFGFMFIEMAGIYKFQLYLHHPTMAMILILSSMILGAGFGSIHSGKSSQDKKEAGVAFYSAIAVVAAVLLLVALPFLGHKLMLLLPMPLLMALVFTVFCAIGFILGHIVPLSIAAYTDGQENLMAWCWAITVTGSVFGTVLASILSREYGMFLVAMLGIAAYSLVALVSFAGKFLPTKSGAGSNG